MVPTDPEKIAAADQSKLIVLYERLCPDDIVALDDPRRPSIAAEVLDVGRAENIAEALSVIEWWRQPEAWARTFVTSVRRSYARMKFES
ncbi:hypothetical protein [Herbaspirillum huttiense]|uniref:hypothetical protein n=1 Tax=Herbaspirillum huttiense TaxID=863372 RepID=UPI00058569A6|nr:hypothetical protein [Herbaspirillum huttiense]